VCGSIHQDEIVRQQPDMKRRPIENEGGGAPECEGPKCRIPVGLELFLAGGRRQKNERPRDDERRRGAFDLESLKAGVTRQIADAKVQRPCREQKDDNPSRAE
jgi:hypothetical protein